MLIRQQITGITCLLCQHFFPLDYSNSDHSCACDATIEGRSAARLLIIRKALSQVRCTLTCDYSCAFFLFEDGQMMGPIPPRARAPALFVPLQKWMIKLSRVSTSNARLMRIGSLSREISENLLASYTQPSSNICAKCLKIVKACATED